MNAYSMPPRHSRVSLFTVPEESGEVTSVHPTTSLVSLRPPATTSTSIVPLPVERISLSPTYLRGTSLAPLPIVPSPTTYNKPRARYGARVVIVANKLIVTAYKIAGLTVLVGILGGLVSYLGVRGFFFANQSWVVPNVMSPNDERVLRVTSQVAQESARRDELVAQRLDLQTSLENATRVAAAEASFQTSFRVAEESDLAKRNEALGRYQGLMGHYAQTKSEIQSASQAFAGLSKERIASDFNARLIDKDTMVNSSFQLAQIAGANLSLSEHSVEIADRIAGLRHEVGSLRNATTNGSPTSGELSYEVVRMQHELAISLLTSQKATDDRDRLQTTLSMLDDSIGEYDGLIARLQSSPFTMAAAGRANLAFVPYDNLRNVHLGDPIYACRFALLRCKIAGHVGAPVEGEVTDKHPLNGRALRGVMIRMELDDPHAVENAVLHVGRAPLFI